MLEYGPVVIIHTQTFDGVGNISLIGTHLAVGRLLLCNIIEQEQETGRSTEDVRPDVKLSFRA